MAEQKEVKKRKIMIVDDDNLLLQTLGSILIMLGACDEDSLIVCLSAQEAWEKLREIDGQVDMIFSDLRTGPGMDGIDLLVKTRIFYGSNLNFILMSGFFTPDNLYNARRAGVDGFLQKPFLIEDIFKFL